MRFIYVLCVISLLNSSLLFADQESDLEKAYKKEFAFLEAQKRSLKNRLKKVERDGKKQIKNAEIEIDKLQNEYLALSSKSEYMSDMMIDVERKAESYLEGSDIVETTIDQARSSLSKYNIEIPEASKDKDRIEAQLNTIFTQSPKLLHKLGTLRRTEGEFFLNDGTKANGTLIKVGNIAAWGVSQKGSGALAPAGEKRLKLWNKPATDTAKAVANGKKPSVAKLFLFESLDKEIEERKSKTPIEVIESGGIIGWVIVSLGLVGLLMILLRVLFLKNASSRTASVPEEVDSLVVKGMVNEAYEFCKRKKGAIARVIAATLRNISRDREHLEDIISESILHESSYLDRFGSVILVIAAVAPLLGLLGTVTGMISTFDIITEFGTGDPKLLSGGISEALVTTELGLIVAIPTLLLGNLLSGWSERIKDDMEKAALRVTNVYQEFIDQIQS